MERSRVAPPSPRRRARQPSRFSPARSASRSGLPGANSSGPSTVSIGWPPMPAAAPGPSSASSWLETWRTRNSASSAMQTRPSEPKAALTAAKAASRTSVMGGGSIGAIFPDPASGSKAGLVASRGGDGGGVVGSVGGGRDRRRGGDAAHRAIEPERQVLQEPGLPRHLLGGTHRLLGREEDLVHRPHHPAEALGLLLGHERDLLGRLGRFLQGGGELLDVLTRPSRYCRAALCADEPVAGRAGRGGDRRAHLTQDGL